MTVKCVAVVKNPVQQDNLCECLSILGAEPCRKDDRISVVVDSNNKNIETIVKLFKHYMHNKIQHD